MQHRTNELGRAAAVVVGALIALGAGAAEAQGMRICERIGVPSQRNECVAAVAGHDVDANGVALCSRIGVPSHIVGCARAVTAGPVSSAALSLCSRIGVPSQIVACAEAVAGHAFSDEAGAVCSRIGVPSQIVACANAARDKAYSSDEVRVCSSNGVPSSIVDCMRAAGQAPRRAAPPPRPRSRGGASSSLVNDTSNGVVTRLYLRPTGARRWPSSAWSGDLRPGQQAPVRIDPGDWDICIESSTGMSRYWPGFRVDDRGLRVIARDDNAWQRQECHTR